jgi:hypothetical protein
MASPFSGLVLGSGALLASPALKDAFVDGTLPIETAVMRLFVAVLVSWIGFSLLGSLLEGTGGAPSGDDRATALPGSDGTVTVRGAVVDSDDTGPANG